MNTILKLSRQGTTITLRAQNGSVIYEFHAKPTGGYVMYKHDDDGFKDEPLREFHSLNEVTDFSRKHAQVQMGGIEVDV